MERIFVIILKTEKAHLLNYKKLIIQYSEILIRNLYNIFIQIPTMKLVEDCFHFVTECLLRNLIFKSRFPSHHFP